MLAQTADADALLPLEAGAPAHVLPVAIVCCLASAWVAARLMLRVRRGLPVVEPRSHPPATWGGAEVAAVALSFLCLLVGAGTWVDQESPVTMQLLVGIVAQAGATLAGVALLRGTGASWSALGFSGVRWGDDLRLAVGGLALVLAPLLALAALLDRIVPYEHVVVSLLQRHRDPATIAVAAVAAIVVAPVAEEFFFRRVLQGWLERALPEAEGAAAVGLSSLAFAAAHVGNGLAPIPLFILGCVLGFVARRTGSIVPCILLHALFNTVAVAGLLLAPSPAGAAG